MLFLENISLFVGSKSLFTDITFSVNPGDRIGVVGRNGTGKSHLMKLLSGETSPDSGERKNPRVMKRAMRTRTLIYSVRNPV